MNFWGLIAAMTYYPPYIGRLESGLFIFGLILVGMEMFLPGFGVAGISGVVLLIIAIFMSAETLLQALIMAFLLAVLVVIMIFVTLRSAKKGVLSRRLILRMSSTGEQGYRSANDCERWLGKQGLAATQLRPAGVGEFENERLDVVTEGEFIDKGTPIIVVQSQGRRIVVKKDMQ
jgi:membrane-bound ClpP family serine protease